MGFDMARAHAQVQAVARSGDVAAGLADLLAYCRSTYPTDAWDAAVGNVHDDIAGIRTWLAAVLTDEPPGPEVAALWFGLYEADEGYVLYVAGVADFDPADESGDWATDPVYWPDRHEAPSGVLRRLPELLARVGPDAAAMGTYVLVLGYACVAISEILRTVDPRLVVGTRDARGLAVGFDEGDFVVLGTVTADGLQAGV